MARLPGNADIDVPPAAGTVPLLAPSCEEIRHASQGVDGGLCQTDFSVPSVRCGGCIRKIERALGALHGVERARVNLSTKRVSVLWRADGDVPPIVSTLTGLGYAAHLDEPGGNSPDRTLSELVRALAVAGFATGNIMLLSVSVWSGADGAARDLFHGISALIALPALAYSGRVFFRSAAQALRHGRTNMDVPISVGVLLAFALSLYETLMGGGHAYFEASVMLLFFLLVGRTLEHLMREKARRAVSGLAKLMPRLVQIVRPDGHHATIPLSDVEPGMTALVPAGERVPVDGRVVAGISDVDCALVTGENVPRSVQAGSVVQGGTLNLTAPLIVKVTAAEDRSFLAEMVRLMETAEAGRPAYRRVADRAAQFYAPVVHAAALASFVGWMVAGSDLHQAATVAVAVLIVTCPCALGLAAPMAQVVAARRLFEYGVVLKDGAALERLAEVDTVVFDKTGTLTMGTPVLQNGDAVSADNLAIAATLAIDSHHPLARALATSAAGGVAVHSDFGHVAEHPGCGLEAVFNGDRYRLGRADWALETAPDLADDTGMSETLLSRNGELLEVFHFDDLPRPGAKEAVQTLKEQGLAVRLISGDRVQPVRRLAARLGLDAFEAEARPQDKVARLKALATEGHKVLMVGDGLNDAPALAAAHVSMALGSAADVGRRAAGLVLLRNDLGMIPDTLVLARRTGRLVRQNFLLAIVYNAAALPLAVLGFVTPLLAAAAMSLSSITVVANALRLNRGSTRARVTADGNREAARVDLMSEPAE